MKARNRLNEWSPPPKGALKFNVDGSALGAPGRSGVGGILRNARRQTLGVFSKALGELWAYEAEVKAILQALIFCREHQLQHILIESDSTLAVGWISSQEVLVRYAGFGKVEDEWVNVKNEMRERSIPLEPSKCHKVKDGDFVLCFLEKGDYTLYFDARVVRIQRRLHDATACKCIFIVRFIHDNSEEEIHWKGVCYRPTQNKSTQEECVVCPSSPKPTQEESTVRHNSSGPTIEPSLSDIENLWP
ncbi:uncharacterized protein LOC130743649 [Lotus japonicus]|uniref:uncharacterized protein LOC130743649 n=1 Tax=Lotus japonicus TaxID=34305 RepID=UPI0025830D54|nr:uncharacterized protein LOC130743649 [Lotus japonicus]